MRTITLHTLSHDVSMRLWLQLEKLLLDQSQGRVSENSTHQHTQKWKTGNDLAQTEPYVPSKLALVFKPIPYHEPRYFEGFSIRKHAATWVAP